MIHGRKVIGIIGGMGPMATADLFIKIIENTVAQSDQEHLHVLIDNNTDIPDRTACILAGSDEPLALMVESARRLAAQGADLLLIPCNTAHHFHDGVAAAVDIPVLNMPEITAEYCAQRGFTCVALLSTAGTVRAGIYEPYFEKRNIRLLHPTEVGIQNLMYLIYDEIKAGRTPHPERLYPEIVSLEEQGAQAFLLACTELPLVFHDGGRVPFIDPTLLLARAAVRQAGGQLKEE